MDPSDVSQFLDPNRVTLIGVLVFLVIAFIRGWIVPGWTYKERDEEADHVRDQRDALVSQFHDDVIPALVRSTDALEKATRALERHVSL